MEAAFFDLDKTVISRSSVIALAPYLYRAGLLQGRTVLHGVYRQLLFSMFGADEALMERARARLLEIARGWDARRIRDIVEAEIEGSIRPIVYEAALELIAEHKRAGRRVYIVSTSPEEIVVPLAAMLGIDDVVASRAAIREGKYTGAMEFYSYGPFKAERMQELAVEHDLDLKASYAYSDSITDVPMLEAVGHPCAVNPDRALRRVAHERDWEVRDFHRTLLLRQRLPGNRFWKATGVGAGAAAVALGYGLWYRQRFDELPGLEWALVQAKLIKPRPIATTPPPTPLAAVAAPVAAALGRAVRSFSEGPGRDIAPAVAGATSEIARRTLRADR